MSLSFILFLIFSIIRSGFCENCQEALLENFRKTFNLSDKCDDDCVILKPQSYFDNGNWSGICSRNRYLMFPKWKCANVSDSVALLTQNTCQIFDKNNFHFDDDCFAKFTNEICDNLTTSKFRKRSVAPGGSRSGTEDKNTNKGLAESNEGTNDSFLYGENVFRDKTSSTEATTENIFKTKRTTTTERTESTSTEKTTTTTEVTETTELTATEKTKTTDAASTEKTETTEPTKETTTDEIPTTAVTKTSSVSTVSTSPTKTICEPNEYPFENHCYFLKAIPTIFTRDTYRKERSSPETIWTSNLSESFTSACSIQHPDALGLAVETKEENEFILRVLKQLHFYNRTLILTSGVATDVGDIWLGWNQRIDQNIIDLRLADPLAKFFVIDPCKNCWELWDGNPNNRTLLIMCERQYNAKNVVDDLYKQCLNMYRESDCYNMENHVKYCCAKDENEILWFGCPKEQIYKLLHGVHCSWECKSDGYFTPFQPLCKGNIMCKDIFNNITYSTTPKTSAISHCPGKEIGFSSWYCNSNKNFIGLPDFSVCCDKSPICTDTDIFLNMWAGCPNKTVIRKMPCPPGSNLIHAEVTWYCQSDGLFNGSADYSGCINASGKGCSKRDSYGHLWEGYLGTTVYKNCPSGYTGRCWWKCKESGEFDGAEPDCTWCRSKWMDNIAEKIKSNARVEEVVVVMEEFTKKEDLRLGYGHVLNLTADCVALYKKQNHSVGEGHQKFLKGFSKIFKNLAGNPDLWASFSVSSRKTYAEEVIEITQNATFVNLEGSKQLLEPYNATLAELKTDGFDYFIAYNPTLKGCKFPLNTSESDWHLEIKEVNESNSNLAVMGLIMNYSLSSLMFPQGEATENRVMNAPALTFAVAFSRNGEAVVDHSVRVSVSFKHIYRTRMPEFVEIRRRLHKGEKPSGVFNSTVCYHYSDSGWNAEGCSVTYTSKDRTDCTCTHLSTIGLLMSVHKYVPDTTLETISLASSGVTILSLILALLVFFFFDNVRNDRALIGKNLCFCLLIGHVMLITVLDKRFFYIPDDFCRIYAVILHYVFMAAFAWMFVEGCHLYRMLVLVFDSDIEYRYVYLLIGYGVPLVVVGVTRLIGFALQEQPYGQDELCWLKYPNYNWAFTGPVIIITSINFYILIIAMKLAISSRTRTEHSNLTSFKLWLKGWFTLSSLLGITWLFGLALISYNKVLLYGFVLFNGLQGFFIFLFRCVLNEQYNDVFLRRFKSLSYTFSSKREEVVKSETKVVTMSASKSLSSCEIKTKVNACDSEVSNGFLKRKRKSKADVENPEIGINVEVTLKPSVSEAYLRNRMIAQNFAVRRSKATWMKESDSFRYKV